VVNRANKFARTAFAALILITGQLLCQAVAQTNWLDRAPLNTEPELVGLPLMGLGRAYLWLAFLYNFLVFAALLYAFARHEAEFGNMLYVYFGILAGSMLLSPLLDPFIHAFSLLPILGLNVFLLNRFCLVSLKRAIVVAVLYQAFQVFFLLAYKLVRSKYA